MSKAQRFLYSTQGNGQTTVENKRFDYQSAAYGAGRLILKILSYILLIVAGSQLLLFLITPVYEFSDPKPFSGDHWYNPYANIDNGNWRKYNFQVQSKAWGGITSGNHNTNELIDSVYGVLAYDHVATSDYQRINTYGSEKEAYIPTYEHGYGIFKTHHVCIDAEEVLWTDYLFWQNLNMKQWVLDKLQEKSSLVAIAHPVLRNGYNLNDLKHLTNYDMIEVLNNIRTSYDHWDTALSSGQLVWILANDDAHDVRKPWEVGRKFTMINSPSVKKEDILKSMKSGAAYGVDFSLSHEAPLERKSLVARYAPELRKAKIEQDYYTVSTTQRAQKISFIGQGGKVLSEIQNAYSGVYKLNSSDTYVRVLFEYKDGSSLALNPVVRHNGSGPMSNLSAGIDYSATFLSRILYLSLFLSFTYIYLRKNRNRFGKLFPKSAGVQKRTGSPSFTVNLD